MKKIALYSIWMCMYILCIGLAYIQNPPAATKVALVVIALLFFVPGGILLWDALKAHDQKELLRIRVISIVSLSLTLIAFVANLMSIAAPKAVGDALYDVLILVSSPMVCSQYWIISLFLWACLLSASFPRKLAK